MRFNPARFQTLRGENSTRKISPRFLSLLCLGASLCFPGVIAVSTAGGGPADQACGPPNYCARTDRRLEAYPKAAPSVGPAGSVITDPTFGSRLVRVTDEKADPKGSGRGLVTPASAEQNSWNTTSTKFYVVTMGGSFLLYDFNPSDMSVRIRNTPDLHWRGEPQFSFAQSTLLYGVPARGLEFEQYDIASGKVKTVNDPSSCRKFDSADVASDISVSGDDSRFMSVIGPRQDDSYVIYVYDRERGCRWYNTRTGEVGGQWGPKGTVSLAERYGVHNARMAKSGKFVTIARGGGSQGNNKWRVWDVDTLNVVVCPSACSGHHALGYSHVVNPGGDHPFAMLERPLDHLDSQSALISDLHGSPGYWYDSHLSWNDVDSHDNNPVCLSTYRPNNPGTSGTPLAVGGPWENEIVCVEMDGKSSKVWRFAHTYSTAQNGFWSTPRGNVSQDGRFFMFTSDWEDQLGRTSDGKYRTDVFVVELR